MAAINARLLIEAVLQYEMLYYKRLWHLQKLGIIGHFKLPLHMRFFYSDKISETLIRIEFLNNQKKN